MSLCIRYYLNNFTFWGVGGLTFSELLYRWTFRLEKGLGDSPRIGLKGLCLDSSPSLEGDRWTSSVRDRVVKLCWNCLGTGGGFSVKLKSKPKS